MTVSHEYLPETCSLEEIETVIAQALQKTGAQKETDLCTYFPNGKAQLTPSLFLQLKDTDRSALRNLLRVNILDANLRAIKSSDRESASKLPYIGQPLEGCIKEAMAKLNLQKETGLCRYIPHDGGYIHHFTFLKMKSSNPVRVRNLIKEHILDQEPKRMPHRPRKRREHNQTHDDSSHFSHQPTKRGYIDSQSGIAQKQYPSIGNHNGVQERQADPNVSHRSLYEESLRDIMEQGNAKIDQLCGMMKKMIEAISNREHTGGAQKNATSQSTSHFQSSSTKTKCLEIIQKELVIKILKNELDHNLWNTYAALVECTSCTYSIP